MREDARGGRRRERVRLATPRSYAARSRVQRSPKWRACSQTRQKLKYVGYLTRRYDFRKMIMEGWDSKGRMQRF